MEAPEKIYLPVAPNAIGPNEYCDWERNEIPGYNNICYIRKDVLLECINGMLDYIPSPLSLSGARIANSLRELIRRIESL